MTVVVTAVAAAAAAAAAAVGAPDTQRPAKATIYVFIISMFRYLSLLHDSFYPLSVLFIFVLGGQHHAKTGVF